jgi:hypothetical protein
MLTSARPEGTALVSGLEVGAAVALLLALLVATPAAAQCTT